MAKQKVFLPLSLSVKATNIWRMDDASSSGSDHEFEGVRKKALERDDWSCRFCGFKTTKWQEVHHLNDDHSDNRPENLVTACIYCHLCQHIGLAGSNGEAVLAFIPEISQAHINHLVRSIQVAKHFSSNYVNGKGPRDESLLKSAKDMGDTVSAIEARLLSRTGDAERLIGTSNPTDLGDILMRFANEQSALYEKRDELLAGIRLLPLGKRKVNGAEKMPEIVASWMASGGGYSGLHARTWVSLWKQVQAELR